jgi:hypothetical protein
MGAIQIYEREVKVDSGGAKNDREREATKQVDISSLKLYCDEKVVA